MCYLCSIRKRDYKPIKINNMKVKKFYTLQIECHTREEYDKIITFIEAELDTKDCLWYFEDEDLVVQLEYVEKETFEKISKFLKTL